MLQPYGVRKGVQRFGSVTSSGRARHRPAAPEHRLRHIPRIIPAVAIFIVALAAHLFGEGLRSAFEAKKGPS